MLFVGVRGCCSLVGVEICGICVVRVCSGHFSTRPEKIKKCRKLGIQNILYGFYKHLVNTKCHLGVLSRF